MYFLFVILHVKYDADVIVRQFELAGLEFGFGFGQFLSTHVFTAAASTVHKLSR